MPVPPEVSQEGADIVWRVRREVFDTLRARATDNDSFSALLYALLLSIVETLSTMGYRVHIQCEDEDAATAPGQSVADVEALIRDAVQEASRLTSLVRAAAPTEEQAEAETQAPVDTRAEVSSEAPVEVKVEEDENPALPPVFVPDHGTEDQSRLLATERNAQPARPKHIAELLDKEKERKVVQEAFDKMILDEPVFERVDEMGSTPDSEVKVEDENEIMEDAEERPSSEESDTLNKVLPSIEEDYSIVTENKAQSTEDESTEGIESEQEVHRPVSNFRSEKRKRATSPDNKDSIVEKSENKKTKTHHDDGLGYIPVSLEEHPPRGLGKILHDLKSQNYEVHHELLRTVVRLVSPLQPDLFEAKYTDAFI